MTCKTLGRRRSATGREPVSGSALADDGKRTRGREVPSPSALHLIDPRSYDLSYEGIRRPQRSPYRFFLTTNNTITWRGSSNPAGDARLF